LTINVGFGWVLRVRWLRKSPKRRHVFVRRDDSPAALRARHEEAYGLLESRRALRLDDVGNAGLADVEKRITDLGYRWQDEDHEDCRYSYWRFR
jgi:hypothetical protein